MNIKIIEGNYKKVNIINDSFVDCVKYVFPIFSEKTELVDVDKAHIVRSSKFDLNKTPSIIQITLDHLFFHWIESKTLLQVFYRHAWRPSSSDTNELDVLFYRKSIRTFPWIE